MYATKTPTCFSLKKNAILMTTSLSDQIMQKISHSSRVICLLVGLKDVLDQCVLDVQQFWEFCLQLGGIHLIVASGSDNHLGLLFKGEVSPLEVRVHVVLVHFKDLVVANHSWVGEVPYAPEITLCHLNGNG